MIRLPFNWGRGEEYKDRADEVEVDEPFLYWCPRPVPVTAFELGTYSGVVRSCITDESTDRSSQERRVGSLVPSSAEEELAFASASFC